MPNNSQVDSPSPRDTGNLRKAGRQLAKVQTLLWYLILAWVIVLLARYIVLLLMAPKEITFSPLAVVGSSVKSDGAILAGVMSSKLQRLKDRQGGTPAGYGFLQIPSMAVPDPALAKTGGFSQRLEDLNLKVKEVDVNAVVKVVRAVFAPAETQLKGTVTELAATIEIDCQLVRGDDVKASWHSSRAKIAGKDEEVLDGLIDDVLFQFLYDLPRSEQLKEWRGNADPGDYPYPNWQAMEAFVRGLEWLSKYQHDLDHASLIKAQDQLQRLQIVAPDYALGLYFYGIALAENRQEAQAAEVFQQVKNQPDASESIRRNAVLQEAGARLRLYDPKEAEENAVPLLQSLIADLETRLHSALEPRAEKECQQLLALAQAQLGYTYGTLTELTADISWNAKAEPAFAAAEAIVTGHPDWAPADVKEIRFRILNARGYSLFRFAQHSKMAAKEFRERCNEAIEFLQAARLLRPNHYEVLQNLAMIYDDERYDPSLNSLDNAESLYKQTTLFVPEDYYQYERLARIEFRRMQASPLAPLKRASAQTGAKYASEALARRRESREGNLLAAAFAAELWQTETDDNARKAGAQAFRAALDAVVSFRFRPEHKAELTYCETALRELIAKPEGEDKAHLQQIDAKLTKIIHSLP
jgi:hypothetical protein